MMLIWRLLRQHISVGQIVGFTVANLVGLAIILCGVQMYCDIAPVLSASGALSANDFVVISKRVTTDKMYDRTSTRFSEEEIEELTRQPFVKRVGRFRSSQFRINAVMAMLHAQTLLFFESVPDEFIDVKSDKWHFVPGDTTIPIIIPRAYLNLYNFGFSQSMMGLPQLSEQLLSELRLGIEIGSRDGQEVDYEASVVGLSDRINTILVPDSFLVWANENYGHSANEYSSRLIFEVDNPSDTAIGEYLEKRGYQPESNASASSKMSYLLKVALAVVVAVGAGFSLMSLLILALSIYLLLQKNSTKLENLVLAGYTPRRTAAPYKVLVVVLNMVVLLCALIATFVVRSIYSAQLSSIFGVQVVGDIAPMLTIGIVITAIVILFNMTLVQRKVDAISRRRV